MDNMTFGKYIPGNSIIHRLDPRLKICAVFIFLISVFFDAGFIGYGILAIYVLLCSLVSKIKLSHILKAIKPMVFMMLFLMIFNIFLMKTGDVIIKIGSIITNCLYFYKACIDYYFNNINDFYNEAFRINTSY